MENSFDYITENYNRIYNEIEAAKAKYRKPSDHVDFMAVTKTVAPEAVNHAIHCGNFPAGGKSGAGISFQAGLL